MESDPGGYYAPLHVLVLGFAATGFVVGGGVMSPFVTSPEAVHFEII